jgi:hypothetical protein
MDFRQADEEFKRLKARFHAGQLTEADFKTQLRGLMVQDQQGAWWMIGYETERWYRHDGTNWIQADPPASSPQKAAPDVLTQPEEMESKTAAPAPAVPAMTKASGRGRPRLIVPLGVTLAVIVLAGGYFGRSFLPKEAAPAATSTMGTDIAIVEKSTWPASQTARPALSPSRTSAPVLTPSGTPSASQTPEPEFRVFISSSRAILFQGPGLDYSDVKIYPKGEEFVVIARNPYGDWLLVRAADGTEGWLYHDWVDADFDLLTVSTATFIPPPPPPTPKPKRVEPTACIFC